MQNQFSRHSKNLQSLADQIEETLTRSPCASAAFTYAKRIMTRPLPKLQIDFFRAAQFKNNLQTGFMKLGISLIKNVMMQKDPRMDGYWDGNRRRFFGELPP